MSGLFETWVYLAEQPLLWLTLTVGAYAIAYHLFMLTQGFALLNPVLVAILMIVATLMITETDYATYFEGAQFVHFLLGPATVLLAVPLVAQAQRLRRQWLPLSIALIAGSASAIVSALVIGRVLGLKADVVASLLPKSATTPIAMAVAEQIGGQPSLTAVLVILTGITGAIAGVPMLRALGERDPDIKGFATGVAAHGIATARAFQHSERAGAYAGLGMGLNAALTALLVPLIAWLAGLY
ncbi:MAG: LrgB family protein [Spiribacter sp.]|jgi:predicted murein hydrolase (TIGR00659 family)|nr:LrgB family protein [Spiribacter sp.]MDR9489422.1 LrgB family protein [Spiribacter sp.]